MIKLLLIALAAFLVYRFFLAPKPQDNVKIKGRPNESKFVKGEYIDYEDVKDEQNK